jgi:MFS family permease
MQAKKIPIKTPIFYGWLIVLISALTIFFSGPGQTYSVSVFIDSYIDEYGWSRSVVSSMYSVGTLVAGIFMGLAGGFFDRYGHRKMTLLIAILFGVACLWMSFVKTVPMLGIGFFLIRLLGQGSMSLSSVTLPPQWFVRRKGTALSIVSLGGGLSLAILPPFNTWVIKNFGWPMGWRLWTLLLWLVMAPLAYLFIRDTPEDVGMFPDGEQIQSLDIESKEIIYEESWTLKEALETRSFWLIIYTVIVPSAIITGLVFHQISILGEAGLDPSTAALISTVMSLVRLPIILIAGQIADRYDLRYLMAISQGLLFGSIVILVIADSINLVILYGVLVGVQMGIQGLIGGVIWPDYFGRKNLSTIRGVTMMAGVIGSALGPLPFGFAYDIFGGYSEALTTSIIFPIIGVVAGVLAKKPVKE